MSSKDVDLNQDNDRLKENQSDFSRVVKSKAGNLAKEHKLSEELAIWTNHYKSGLVETSDFLSYYSERKVRTSCSL